MAEDWKSKNEILQCTPIRTTNEMLHFFNDTDLGKRLLIEFSGFMLWSCYNVILTKSDEAEKSRLLKFIKMVAEKGQFDYEYFSKLKVNMDKLFKHYETIRNDMNWNEYITNTVASIDPFWSVESVTRKDVMKYILDGIYVLNIPYLLYNAKLRYIHRSG